MRVPSKTRKYIDRLQLSRWWVWLDKGGGRGRDKRNECVIGINASKATYKIVISHRHPFLAVISDFLVSVGVGAVRPGEDNLRTSPVKCVPLLNNSGRDDFPTLIYN